MAAVGAQMGRQQAAVGGLPVLLLGAQDHGAGAVAEQDAGAAVLPVEQAREGLGADHERGLGLAAP